MSDLMLMPSLKHSSADRNSVLNIEAEFSTSNSSILPVLNPTHYSCKVSGDVLPNPINVDEGVLNKADLLSKDWVANQLPFDAHR